MSAPLDLSFSPEAFSGRSRLFPLPNLVIFPHIMQPLHIFELRYRQMLQEALAGDSLLAMVLLAPGWERDYEGRPPLRPVGCLCRIATHHEKEDGTSNILILGLRRIELGRELPSGKLFREAEVELIEDHYSPAADPERPATQRELLRLFKSALPGASKMEQQLDLLLGNEAPLGMLTDLVAYTLDLSLDVKEQLLAEANVDRRAAILIEQLSSSSLRSTKNTFPPDFSAN